MHRRVFPVRYRFLYRVYSLLVDIDRLDEESHRHRLFSHNGFNLLSIHDADHGARDGSALRPWIEAQLARHADLRIDGGRVRLLCFPRVLGYGFDPISLWFCEDPSGRLLAVLCEVHNTFGETHSYLLHANGAGMQQPVRGEKGKVFHVSPFIGMDARYHFRIALDTHRLSYTIRQTRCGRHHLSASYDGRLEPASDAALALSALTVPLLGLKVMLAIHWQALLIWLRGARFHPKPHPPAAKVS
jgi:DUF1365 family protein